MADLAHLIGDDLVFTSTGDAVMVSGVEEGQERVLRRLLSNPKNYSWHPEYGAGLGRYIGMPVSKAKIKGNIQKQIRLEKAVQQLPPPKVTVTAYPGEIFEAKIEYVDSTDPMATSVLTVPIGGLP